MAEDSFAQMSTMSPSKAEDSFAQIVEEQSSDLDLKRAKAFIQEIVEGVGSGLTKIPQGILELGATGIDLVAGTETAGRSYRRF